MFRLKLISKSDSGGPALELSNQRDSVVYMVVARAREDSQVQVGL